MTADHLPPIGGDAATGVPAMARHIARSARTALRRRKHVDRIIDQALPDPSRRTSPLVVGIDGRSGSGKTVLAQTTAIELRAELLDEIPDEAARHDSVRVLALEDLYVGWEGLQAGLDNAAKLLEQVVRGEGGCAPRWDWHEMRLYGNICVGIGGEPMPLVLIIEGCGAGSDMLADYVDVLVWMEVPTRTRQARVRARDGEWEIPWATWAAQEDEVLARRDVAAAADIVVGTVPRDAGR